MDRREIIFSNALGIESWGSGMLEKEPYWVLGYGFRKADFDLGAS